MNILSALLVAVSCTTLTLSVAAQDRPAGRSSVRPLPQSQTENGVTYICGGIGMTEAARMKQIAPDYELMLTFAASNGAYLADIDVAIANDSGEKLVATRCNGPIMLVDVPQAGTYRITAETEGHKVVRTARVKDGQKGKRLSVTWPAPLVDSTSTAPR